MHAIIPENVPGITKLKPSKTVQRPITLPKPKIAIGFVDKKDGRQLYHCPFCTVKRGLAATIHHQERCAGNKLYVAQRKMANLMKAKKKSFGVRPAIIDGERVFQCEFCPEFSKRKLNIESHLKLRHQTELNRSKLAPFMIQNNEDKKTDSSGELSKNQIRKGTNNLTDSVQIQVHAKNNVDTGEWKIPTTCSDDRLFELQEHQTTEMLTISTNHKSTVTEQHPLAAEIIVNEHVKCSKKREANPTNSIDDAETKAKIMRPNMSSTITSTNKKFDNQTDKSEDSSVLLKKVRVLLTRINPHKFDQTILTPTMPSSKIENDAASEVSASPHNNFRPESKLIGKFQFKILTVYNIISIIK